MTRKVETYKNGEWAELEFMDLKEGDLFRMFEPTGERVEGLDYFAGTNEWVCTTGPYLRDDGVWTVNCSLPEDLGEEE